MSFSIEFIDAPLEYLGDDNVIPSAVVEIVLGDLTESFASSIFTWTKSDYEAQWRFAIEHLLSGNDRAALMTEFISPEVSSHLRWWPMYKVGQTVHFQEHLLFFENAPEPFLKLQGPFLLDRQFTYVRDRRTTNEDGEGISEWSVSLAEVKAFASTLKSMG